MLNALETLPGAVEQSAVGGIALVAAPVHPAEIDHHLLELFTIDRVYDLLGEERQFAVFLDAAFVNQVIAEYVRHQPIRFATLVNNPASDKDLERPACLRRRELCRRLKQFAE